MKPETYVATAACPKAKSRRLGSACARRLLPLLSLLALPAVVLAQDYTYTSANGAITITGYNGPGGAVDIPNTINGYPVIAIGSGAFSYNANLTKVNIPSTVLSIETNAFAYCTGLQSATLPSIMASVGDGAFSSCLALTNITIPGSVTNTGAAAFSGCSGLRTATIESGVTNIGSQMFEYCTALCNVTIPGSVAAIGDGAFAYCGNLVNVTIPSGVVNIGDSAFDYCTGLATITIGDTVANIGGSAFYDCSSLANITIPGRVTNIDGGAFQICTNLRTATLARGVTSIGPFQFASCTALTNVTIPDTVTFIGGSAFYNCTLLTGLTIPASVTSIEPETCLFCTSLTNVTIANSVTNIGDWAFNSCSSLSSVVIPRSVTSLGVQAFAQCASLTNVYFEGNASAISVDRYAWPGGIDVFRGDTNAMGHHLPGTTGWGWGAGWGATFAGMPVVLWTPQVEANDGGLGVRSNQFGFTINWAGGMTVVVEAATNLAQPAWYPLQTNTLGSGSFYFSDAQWKSYPARFYRFPGRFSEFAYATNNGAITIAEYIGVGGAVTIPDRIPNTTNGLPVTAIASKAFYGCWSMTSVAVPGTITSIGDQAFAGCSGLAAITVITNNPAYSSVDGVLFDKSQSTLVQCPAGKRGAYTIPDTVGSIGDSAFYNCYGLTSVTIGNGVGSIGDSAFYNCYGLTRVTIPNSVTNVAESAFSACTALTRLILGKNVTSIGDWAFFDCFSLTEVYFQGDIPDMGDYDFQYDDSTTFYYLPGTTGWVDWTYAGLPTLVWTPQVETRDASFGVRTNQFGFNINWASGMTVVVEASTNLANPTWTPLATNTLTSSSAYCSDPQWTNYPVRFYRLRWP
jgi:hypothetical protein